MKTARQHNAPQIGEYEFRHATVERDGFRVPLIGIPQNAVLQECDLCHEERPMSEIELVGSQALCKKCRQS